ncbi:MAG: M48 family metalloprotease [Acidobacteriota bacterium]|nr:M48 family metalloprotease [Acidobacteriota bacterium]
MSDGTRRVIAIVLAMLFLLQTTEAVAGQGANPAPPTEAAIAASAASAAAAFAVQPALSEVAGMPSLEVAALAVRFNYKPGEVKAAINALKAESKSREQAYSARAKAADQRIDALEAQLSRLPTTLSDPQVVANRQMLQCEILKIKQGITDEAYTFLHEQISTDARIARLNLLLQWKAADQQIRQQIANGTISKRRHGNVLDIGHRGSIKPFDGQQKDVAWGEREIETARRQGRLPKSLQDAVVDDYVRKIGERLASNGDLSVPLHIFVVQQEVRKDGRPVIGKDGQPEQVANAMALPGGFVFIYAGLILSAQNESELAGVMAHEMAHVAARHSARMASKGTKFGLLQMAAIIGMSLFAPGLFQAGSYLAYQLKGLLLQSIMNGLGLVFTINALGVSRDSEMEADQLGMQYAWKAGYDPRGIITLFDWMATHSGYASRTSFFATHPAFGDRTLGALKEYTALASIDPGKTYLADTAQFEEIQARLRKELHRTKAEIQQEEKARPTLKIPGEVTPEGCAAILAQRPASQPAD